MNKKDGTLSDEDFQKIRSIYLSNVRIFDTKFSEQFLICPVGVIGSGKSTVIIPLSEKLEVTRVSTDEIRKMLKEKGFNYDRAREMMLSIISELVSKCKSIAIDANCGSRDALPQIEKLVEEYSLKVFWLRINSQEDFIVDKLKNFKHSWLFQNGEEAVKAYYIAKAKHGDLDKIGVDFIYTFDTSKNDINLQIEEATEVIRINLTPIS